MRAIRAARAFDGERAIPGGATVLVDAGRVVGVEPAGAPVPSGCELLDFPDATVLPGLVDMHVHLGGDAQAGALQRLADYSDADLDAVIAESLRRQLAAGVTTVRDLGDRRWSALAWRDRVRAEPATVAPSILASGPPITIPGGHCWSMGGAAEGSAELVAAVRERAERGADVVKIMLSGGVTTPGTNVMGSQFTPAEVRTVVSEAHAHGLAVTAHAHGLPAVEQAVDAGVDGIEHCTCLTAAGFAVSDALIERLANGGVVVCPTLGRTANALPPASVLALMERTGMTWEARQRHTERMHRGGVVIVSGTDAGISTGKPHGILPAAIVDLVAGGIAPADALASATSVAARSARLGRTKGRLATGYDADLLVVTGDPLSDARALDHVVAVVVRGTLAPPTAPAGPAR